MEIKQPNYVERVAQQNVEHGYINDKLTGEIEIRKGTKKRNDFKLIRNPFLTHVFPKGERAYTERREMGSSMFQE